MVKGKVRPTCCLSYSEGAETKPKSASYTCECGTTFKGLKAWREHMVARSQLRKRKPLLRYAGSSTARARGVPSRGAR